MKKPLLASFIFSTILVALSANAQDADASKPAQAYISDPNATYISADPNAPHYDLRDVPYEDRIRDAQSYQDLSDIRNEILRRDDLSKEEKLKLFDAISEETTRRIDVDHAVQTVSIWGKGITGILLETAGYSPMLIKTPLGGVLVAWGQGLINEDSAVDIMTKMGTSLLLDRLLGGAIKNAASQVAKNTGSKVEKFADNLIKNISKNPENCNIVRRIINKNTTTAIRQRLKEIKRTSDGKLSVAELAMKDFLKGEWISAMESFVYETTEWAVHYLANVIQNNMQNNGEDLIRERIERDADFAEVLYEYAMVLSMRNHGYEIDQEDLEGLRDRLIALGDDPITRTLLENVLRELENLTRPRPFNGLFPNKQEKLFNDIWEMGEEYSTPPPPCKCGETCACNGDRRAKWEKAYADFRKKQQLAYDRLNRDRSGPNSNLSDEVNEKNLTDYEENEEKDLIKAANDLADAYTAGCDCPNPDPEPEPNPLPMPNIDPNHPLAPQRIGGWTSNREGRYNEIWDEGEEYAYPPSPCKCGIDCPCYRGKLERWAKAYEDFKEKQKSAYWALMVIHAEGWLRRWQTADDLLGYVPVFGDAYGLTRLMQQAPEIGRELLSLLRSEGEDLGRQGQQLARRFSDATLAAEGLQDSLEEINREFELNGIRTEQITINNSLQKGTADIASLQAQNIENQARLKSFEESLMSTKAKAPTTQGLNQRLSDVDISIWERKIGKMKAQIADNAAELERIAARQAQLEAQRVQLAARAETLLARAGFQLRDVVPGLLSGVLFYMDMTDTGQGSISDRWGQQAVIETNYDIYEQLELEEALENLRDAYNAGCDCPESKVEPPPTPTLFTSNIPEFNEPDWREKHPIWAFILERVLPEFIRMIIDILLNHPELTIESLLKFDANGNPIIHDGVPEFNPNIEIDEIPTHPLPQISEIPNQGTSDDDVYYGAKEANRKAEEALLTPPQCNCNESVVKLLELKNLIEQHKKAIEDFRLAHIAYEKSFDAIGDRLGDVFVDIGGNAVGALFGPHLKDIFCAATESLDIIGWATTGEYEISKLDLFWKVAEILVERFKEYYKKIKDDLPKEVVKQIGKELGERSIDIGLMFAKILVNIPITMYDVLTDWWDARNANDNAKEKLAELTNRLNIEVSIYLANEGCYCKPGCMCKHCLVKRKIVITYPDDPDDPWHWVYGGNITTPNDILIGDGGGYENGGIIGGVPDLGSLIDGIGGGVLDSGGISIPDFGVSGSDSPIVPDSIGNPAIAITASGILNTANINSDKGKASVVVDGNKGGGASKRNIGDIGGQGQSQIWSNQK